MALIRGLAGAVVALVALLLAVVAVVLCVTVILLPLGLPLLGYAGRLFALALKLMLPRAVSHPVRRFEKTLGGAGRKSPMDVRIAGRTSRDCESGPARSSAVDEGRGCSLLSRG